MPGKKKRILKEFQLNEISTVDRPAQSGALMSIMKRDKPLPFERDDVRKFEDYMEGGEHFEKKAALTTAAEGHTHFVPLNYGDGEISHGYTSYSGSDSSDLHYHPYIVTEDGDIIIGQAHGHTHEIDTISKQLTNGKDNPMSKTQTTGTPENDDVAKERDAAVAKAERLEKVVALPADQREHFDAIEKAEDQDAFLAKSGDERAEIVKAAADAKNDENPVVYTATDGTEYRKNDDPRLVKSAKDNDALRADVQKANDKAYDADLTKRAEDLQHIPGDVNTRKAMLKAIDRIEDDEERQEALKSLQAQDKSMGEAFKSLGTTGTTATVDEDSPAGRLDAMVQKRMKDAVEKGESISEADAYAAVLSTEDGAKAYAETQAQAQ